MDASEIGDFVGVLKLSTVNLDDCIRFAETAHATHGALLADDAARKLLFKFLRADFSYPG
jgi:hypothetical protein